MKERTERLLDGQPLQELDLHLPQPLRAAAAPRGGGGRPVPRLRDLRRGRPAAGGAAGAEGPRPAGEGAPAAAHPVPHLLGQELRARSRGSGRRFRRRPDLRPRGRALPRDPHPGPGAGLRRPAAAHGLAPRRERGGARPLPPALPLRAGGRVPGHQPRAVRPDPPPRAAGRQRDRGRRRGPVHLLLARRRHQQHPRLREGLPGRARAAPGGELPLHAEHPRPRGRAGGPQREAQGQDPAGGEAERGAGAPAPGRRRVPGGGLGGRPHRLPARGGGARRCFSA